jgi:hypothetical protein
MKSLQYAVCGLLITVAAAAQTSPAPPASQAPAPAPAASSGKPIQLSTLGQTEVKGPEHPLTPDQAKELYIAMGYEKTLEQGREQQISAQKVRAPFIPQDVWDDFDATSKKIDYPTAFYDVYKKYLSTDDAAKLIDFSKTAAGKAYFENSPAITRETQQAIGKLQQEAGQEVQGRHKDEIEAAVKKYREEHAPKPAPSLGPTSPTPGAAAPATPPAGAATPAKPATPPSTPPATPPASTPPNQ